MLSDNWLSRYRLLENVNKCDGNGTRTRTTGVTTIALLHFVQSSAKNRENVNLDHNLEVLQTMLLTIGYQHS